MNRMIAALFFFVGIGTLSGTASAHPHAWIDIAVDVIFDSTGRVTAIRQHWLFDEFYTAETVQKGERERMELLTTRILKNLKPWGYFTRVHSGERPMTLKVPTEHSARMEGHRLLMTFVTPLDEPVEAISAPLTYSVFDPTYFIEMLHAEIKKPVRLIGAPSQCNSRLIHPTPDPKAVAKAAALDRTQNGGDGLGVQFAEKVEIQCRVQH